MFPSTPSAELCAVTILIAPDIAKLTIFPTIPPRSPINAASIRNICLIFFKLQPSTLMTPISFVLSYMDIIIVFAIPIAATIREMAPIPPSTAWITAICFFMLSIYSTFVSTLYPISRICFATSLTLLISSTLTCAEE